jgi:hypothetical protein
MPRRVWGREVGTHNSALEYARPLSGCVYMQSPITASELSGEPVAPSRPSTCGMYPDSKSVCKGNLADGDYFLEKEPWRTDVFRGLRLSQGLPRNSAPRHQTQIVSNPVRAVAGGGGFQKHLEFGGARRR